MYSFPRLVREALRRHSGWEPAWRSPEPKPRYDVVIVGGGAGARGRSVCSLGLVFERDNATVQAGQWFEIITPGAGGYGPPDERDRTAVARDVAQDVIDAPTAREVYGFKGV